MTPKMARGAWRAGVMAVSFTTVAWSVIALGARPAGASPPAPVALSRTWTHTLADSGAPVALSSPNVANLDGSPAVVFGDRAGSLYAYHLVDGSAVGGWPVSAGGLPVDSPVSVNGSTVYVGTGNAELNKNFGGAYEAFNANGSRAWTTTVPAFPSGPTPTGSVITGLAIGTLQNQTSVVSGSLGQQQDELNAANGSVAAGFPWFQADSNFTTPAIADLYGNGVNEIIEGGDSTGGNSFGVPYSNGGHLRVLSDKGNLGTGSPSGGLVCSHDTDEVVQSSPAVGTFLGGGGVGITFGTGTYWGGVTTDEILATDTHCGLQWATRLDGATNDSPALLDALGNNSLQIAEGTAKSATNTGTVYLLNGSNGSIIWQAPALGQVIGGITSADFGEGYQDLVVPSSGGLQILDGRTGAQVATVPAVGLQSSPLITHDPGGTIGVTIAGYNGLNQGFVTHYQVAGSNGALVNETGAWPQFHHDPQLTGNAGIPPPVVAVPCNPPTTSPQGYDLFASDGGVFNYGNLPFCGSTGNISLAAPVSGGAVRVDGGGYWETAGDGGVFAFGDAPYKGSAQPYRPVSPIVGIAATRDGQGYWLVGADGGVFSFGDATYFGSAAPYHPSAPIVGIAATPSGQGYWLVGSDGGVFTFGDAGFSGSAASLPLTRPIVGIAADPASGGYWLGASDGGVFAFNAPFLGSEGGVALVRPVVGIAASGAGGYRLVASDGGVFDFGAPFFGSAASLPLVRPIVGFSGAGA